MSNYKKKQEQRANEQKYAQMVTDRDKEIMSALQAHVAEQKQPFDRKMQMYFYSGAIWSDEHPYKKITRKWWWFGFAAGALLVLVVWCIWFILKMEGAL